MSGTLDLEANHGEATDFAEFMSNYLKYGQKLTYYVGFLLFVGIMAWETTLGQRFGLSAWLFIIAWLTPQTLALTIFYRKSTGRKANQSTQITILMLNAMMQTVLSVWHTKVGDTTPYFHVATLGQVAFCYAFTSLRLRDAIATGLAITTGYLVAIFLLSPLSVTATVQTAFVFLLINSIGALSSWRVEENYRLQFKLSQQLTAAAERDPLTDLQNRRNLNSYVHRLIEHGNTSGSFTAIAQIDLDKFKAVNDHFGHPVGDALLQRTANGLSQFSQHPLDIVARVGGDEFLVAWTADSYAAAKHQALDIVRSVSQAGQEAVTATTGSVGLLILAPMDATPDISKTLSTADSAALAAKAQGGNCLVVANEQSDSWHYKSGRSKASLQVIR